MLDGLAADFAANGRSPFRRVVHALFWLRLEQATPVGKKLCAAVKKALLFGTCCEVPACAIVGGGFGVPHLNGIVISPYARIGARCRIMQQVTIGVDEFKDGKRAARIGDDVFIGAGAKIIGPVEVGSHVVIGANAIVTKDVPDYSTVVGANRVLGKPAGTGERGAVKYGYYGIAARNREAR